MEVDGPDGFYMNIDGMKDMNLSPTNWDPNSKKFSSPQKTTWPFLWLINLPSLMYPCPRNKGLIKGVVSLALIFEG